MQLRSIGNFSRAILLIISILLLGLATMWLYKTPILLRVHKSLLLHYEQLHSRRLDKLIQQLRQDPVAGIEKLEALLMEWQPVAKRDRVAKYKVKAFEVLVEHYRQLKDTAKAHAWVKQWLQFDDRDLYAYANEALIFYEDITTREQGLQMLERLYERFPHHGYIGNVYLGVLKEANDYIKALAVLQQGSGFRHNWQVFGDIGNGFNQKDSLGRLTLEPKGNNRWGITFPKVDQLNAIRIDLPGKQWLITSDIRFDLESDQGRGSFYPKNTEITVENMSISPTSLISYGHKDPYFYWPIPAEWQGKPITVSYSAKVLQSYPEWVKQWLTNTDSKKVRYSLEQAGMAGIDTILDIRHQLIMSRG